MDSDYHPTAYTALLLWGINWGQITTSQFFTVTMFNSHHVHISIGSMAPLGRQVGLE